MSGVMALPVVLACFFPSAKFRIRFLISQPPISFLQPGFWCKPHKRTHKYIIKLANWFASFFITFIRFVGRFIIVFMAAFNTCPLFLLICFFLSVFGQVRVNDEWSAVVDGWSASSSLLMMLIIVTISWTRKSFLLFFLLLLKPLKLGNFGAVFIKFAWLFGALVLCCVFL